VRDYRHDDGAWDVGDGGSQKADWLPPGISFNAISLARIAPWPRK